MDWWSGAQVGFLVWSYSCRRTAPGLAINEAEIVAQENLRSSECKAYECLRNENMRLRMRRVGRNFEVEQGGGIRRIPGTVQCRNFLRFRIGTFSAHLSAE